jgi:hypothetical protein
MDSVSNGYLKNLAYLPHDPRTLADEASEKAFAPPPQSSDDEHVEFDTHGFISLSTHDLSSVEEYIPNMEGFAEDLQVAINAAWPTRNNKSRYYKVNVLLLSLEDDNLRVEQESRRLGYVLTNLYPFDMQYFKIPRRLRQSHDIPSINIPRFRWN